jgi:hypothetical protein
MGADAMNDADINFYFDPLCPFAWMTSKWVRQVAAQRDYTVDWRFISLRMLNADVDYDSRFPAGYEAGHTRCHGEVILAWLATHPHADGGCTA